MVQKDIETGSYVEDVKDVNGGAVVLCVVSRAKLLAVYHEQYFKVLDQGIKSCLTKIDELTKKLSELEEAVKSK